MTENMSKTYSIRQRKFLKKKLQFNKTNVNQEFKE